MAAFKTTTPEEFTGNPFSMIGSDWMLVCAQKQDGSTNAMTAAWGGMGVMWGLNVAYVVIRPTRFTKEFVDASDNFSLSFFEGQKKVLNYMGTVSGRDEDKIKKSALTVLHNEKAPYFEQAQIVLQCKKLYAQELLPGCFIAKELDEKWYPIRDYHTLYIAQIEKILVKD